ncbi:hypothetical protein Pcinc_003751 [Petrolisthes cinctipes]|uniref:Uncharacterized protein n=1 Tax=Petrolisthes cinctipes TaxID=88211 RepID=A0AAE1GIF7_PETCI|nr:hypothetical protein Pcinc_003751 [Petrolisthes cinctipes]
MDSATITKLLESQERAYKNATEVVVKNLTERIHKLEATVSDLTASLEFSQNEIDALKTTIKTHEAERVASRGTIDKLSQHIDSTQLKIKDMEDRINYQEDYSRRNNIRISGVEEQSSEQTWEQSAAVVSSLLKDKMQLPGLELERAHRIGQHRDGRPRPIVARFSRFCNREAVMRTQIQRHQVQEPPVSSQDHQRGPAAVIEVRPVGDDVVKGAVAGLGSAAGGTPGGVGVVEQSGAVQTFPPLPTPSRPAGTPAARASPGLRPQEIRKNPRRIVKKYITRKEK